MRYSRRLPPLLRAASILGVLFPLVSLVLLVTLLIKMPSTFPQLPRDFFRVMAIALNLGLLSGACSFAIGTYRTRFRRLDTRPFPLDSWQSQLLAILLLAALPLCAITLAVVIPPPPAVFGPAFPVFVFASFAVSMLGALVLIAAHLWLIIKTGNQLMRTPRTE